MRLAARIFVTVATVATLALGSIAPDLAFAESRERPERTEMSRAIRNCHRAMAVGGILGTVVGAVAGGQRHRTEGAVIGGLGGAAIGGAACLIMIQHARDEARILAVERLAAASPGSPQLSQIPQGKGGSLQLIAQSADVQLAAAPRSIRYPTIDGSDAVSPRQICRRDDRSAQLYCRTDTGEWTRSASAPAALPASAEIWQPLLCRRVTPQVQDGATRTNLPGQLWCRTGANEWQPYAERSASSSS
jgi:hypothetical protein